MNWRAVAENGMASDIGKTKWQIRLFLSERIAMGHNCAPSAR